MECVAPNPFRPATLMSSAGLCLQSDSGAFGASLTAGARRRMGTAMLVEFVQLAEKREDSFAALCARFGISRKTGYKWLKRYRAQGHEGLRELSRRPKSSPRRTPDAIVNAVLALRQAHPAWSASRIRE